ncbi:hypothetical protein RFI_05294, partial [Reticulomyxa filosa]
HTTYLCFYLFIYVIIGLICLRKANQKRGKQYKKKVEIKQLKKKQREKKRLILMIDTSYEIQKVARLFTRIATPMIKEDSELGMEVLYHALNAHSPFYKEYGHDWVCPHKQQRGTPLNEEKVAEYEEFRKKIVENVQLDYFFENRWKTGTVLQVKQLETQSGQPFTVLDLRCDIGPQSLRHRRNSTGNDVAIDTCIFEPSHYRNFAPPGSQVMKFLPTLPKWRRELTADSQCDCLDSVRKWYTCHVTAADEMCNLIKVNYDEWSNKYDEWINKFTTSLSLKKKKKATFLLTQAKGGRTSGGVSDQSREVDPKVDDEDDPTDEGVFAIYRGDLGQVSFHVVAALNEFGHAGGFEMLLERLDNHKPNMPVKTMRLILTALAKSVKALTRRTYQTFILPLHDRVWKTLESMTDVELRDLKKEILTRIVQSMEELLRREKTEEEVAQITETFQLAMALRRLTSQTIERRVNGVQHIAWVCVHARRAHPSSSSLKFITVEFLLKWIEENKLLETLFGPKSHPQLMKQATDILKFICVDSTLTLDHLSIIWGALERAAKKSDDVENELQTLCKIVEDISHNLTTEHFEFLFKKFESMSLKELTEHHLQLMKDLSQHTYKQTTTTAPAERVTNLLWNVVQDDSAVDDKLVNEAKNMLKEVLNAYYSRELRLPTLIKCVTNLADHKSVVSSIQILKKIVETYPSTSSLSDEAERWTIIEHLNTDFSMMKNFFADIQYFKEKANAKAKEVRSACEHKEDYHTAINQMKCIPGARFVYLDEIKERLDFLDFVLNQSKIRFKKEHIDTIWDAMVVNCLTPEEREEAFKWFRKLMAGSQQKSLEDDIPEHLFINKFLKDMTPESMTLPAYDSFEKFFLLVNHNKKNIQMVDNEKSFYVTNYDDLIGVDYLWKISIVFLNSVCNRLGSDLKPQVGRIRKSILERSMKELSQTVDAHKKTPKTETRDQCVRVLDLIHQFLNSTESRGLGGFRSHNALSRGKKWHLNIIDRVSFTGYGRPPHFRLAIHENDTLWELRCVVANKIDRTPEMIHLYSGNKLEEEKNSTTIAALNIRDGSNVHVSLKDDKSQRVPLVTTADPPQLVERAKVALEKIFKQFAKNTDGTMSHNDMRDYILACGAGEGSATKSRIQSIFSQHGDFEDRLDANGFSSFYRQAAVDRPEHVWNDLTVFKYRYDLRHQDEARKEEEELLASNPETLPRYILAHEAKYFNLLFDDCLTLGDPLILSAAWKLLLRLPTNDAVRSQVSTLAIVEKETDWMKLLPTDNLFRLVYSLLICESLTVSPESLENENILQERVEWRSKFLKKKGFEHLLKVLHSVKYENKIDTRTKISTGGKNTLDIDAVSKNTQQLAIAVVLKMIHLFFLSAIDCIPGMEGLVEQLRDISSTSTAEDDSKKENAKKDQKAKKGQTTEGGTGQAPMAPSRPNGEGQKKKSFGSTEWTDMDWTAGYGQMDGMSSDEDSGDEDDDDNLASQLEKKFEEDVNKASPMPMDLLALLSANLTDSTQESSSGNEGGDMKEESHGKFEEKADKDEKIPD